MSGTFLLTEDEALRNLLIGVKVSDDRNGERSVGVWFGQPDMEIRNQAWPYMTINLIDISEARERMMAGRTNAVYLRPTGVNDDNWDMDLPIPVNLDYQITTYARQPRHDRQILRQLMYSRLPLRYGSLSTGDGTVRRLDVLDIAKRDMVESDKRVFMNMFTVRVSSEMPSWHMYHRYTPVSQVSVEVDGYSFDISPQPGNARPVLTEPHVTTTETTNTTSDPSFVGHITITP